MYPMDKFSAIMCPNNLMAEQKGDEDQLKDLEADNEKRRMMGYPTVEEDMEEILEINRMRYIDVE